MPLAYAFAPFRLVPAERRLWCGDNLVRLGGRAFDVLLVLVERRDRTVSKGELLELVWPRLVVEENNLQVQVAALRKVLGHPAIATVPGRGYRFTRDVSLEGAEATGAATSATAAAMSASPGAAATADAAPARPTGNLPVWQATLYGREADLSAVAELLQCHRLITLTGPAGIGKTRLAQAAAGHGAGFDAVWWVDLASLTEPALLTGAVASTLGASPHGGRDPLAAVAAAVRGGRSLLVLDNAEHLVDAVCAWATRMLALAPRLTLLVTSQEILHAPGEQVLRIGPLSVPEPAHDQAGAHSGALALFVARAQAADRHFTLTDGHRAAAAEICRRLDGIPLAIELAAARLPLLGIEGLRARLDQRLQVLTSGERGALRRHRTLREALDWSYQLLSAAEQAVLRRLGVFAGGFTLAAAQQVAADGAAGIDEWDALEHLGALVDKSLVVADGGPEPRYRLLETTRLFALERLIEHGEAAAARQAHRQHYVELAEAAIEAMQATGAQGLAVFDGERDNLLLAMAWTQDDEQGLLGLRLAAAMRWYWTSRSLVPRGLLAARAALAHPGVAGASEPRILVECTAAHFCLLTGEIAAGEQHAERAVTLARELGDARTLSMALHWEATFRLRRGELEAARRAADESLALVQDLGDGHPLGNALWLAADLAERRGQRGEARALVQRHLEMRERLGHRWSQMLAHLRLAQLSVDDGEPDAALPPLRAALALEPAVGSEFTGLHLMSMSAEWAAATGRGEWALLFDAACRAHMARGSLEDVPEPAQQQSLARVRATLPPARLAALEAAGSALDYRAAQQAVGRFLAQPDADVAEGRLESERFSA